MLKADLVLLVLLVLAWEFSRSQTVASGKTWEKLSFIMIPIGTMCVCNEFFVIHIKWIVHFLHDFMLILDKAWLLVEVNISPPLWSFFSPFPLHFSDDDDDGKATTQPLLKKGRRFTFLVAFWTFSCFLYVFLLTFLCFYVLSFTFQCMTLSLQMLSPCVSSHLSHIFMTFRE